MHSAIRIFLGLCAGGLTFSQSARAQWAQHIEQPWQSQVTRAHYDAILEAIVPDEEQKPVLDELFRIHSEEFATLAKEGRDWLSRSKVEYGELVTREGTLRTERDDATAEQKKLECEWATRLAQLDANFDENLLLMLDADQEQAWRDYELQRRWNRLGRMDSRVPWGTVRLSAVVENMHFDEGVLTALAPALEEYESAVTPLVEQVLFATIYRARTSWQELERTQRYYRRMTRESEMAASDSEKLEIIERIDRQRGAMEFVRTRRELAPQISLRIINQTFTERIASLLPPELVTPFMRQVHRESDLFFTVKTQVHRTVERLINIDGLSEERKATFAAALVRLSERLDTFDERRAQWREENFQAYWNDPYNSKKLQEIQERGQAMYAEKYAIVDEALAELLASLTAEEKAALPAPAAPAPATKSSQGS